MMNSLIHQILLHGLLRTRYFQTKYYEQKIMLYRDTQSLFKKLAERQRLSHAYIFSGNDGKQKDELVVKLQYEGKTPALTDIRRVSRPGVRIYAGVKKLPRVLGGLGINILSTPQGVMADKQAKKLHVGGEIIAQAW